MTGGCLEGVRKVSGRCLEGVWKVSGWRLKGIFKVSENYLTSPTYISSVALPAQLVWKFFVDYIFFGRYLFIHI